VRRGRATSRCGGIDVQRPTHREFPARRPWLTSS
jgi:hypothetical protein